MQWRDFHHDGTAYPLNHLHPFSFDFVVAAKDGKPEQVYHLNVEFSLHCFTRKAVASETIAPELAYSDNRETRIFDFARYQDSQQLPDLIRSLPERPCFHDRHGNYYVFEVHQSDRSVQYYSVFFTLSKASRKPGLNLYISSAHMRDEKPYASELKSIRFRVLVHNKWHNKPVKPAP